MTETWDEARLLPQIDDLTVEQLRRRAADNREDAFRLNARPGSGAVVMLLADAERCEARADRLEAWRATARPAGPEGLAVENALDRLLETPRESTAGVQARGARGPHGHRSPRIADACVAALRPASPAGALP